MGNFDLTNQAHQLSVFDLFTIGIGPSSSHSVGPMRAALLFVSQLNRVGCISRVAKLNVQLYGSLGLTGQGHGTDKAIILGLQGEKPDTIEIDSAETKCTQVSKLCRLRLDGGPEIVFDPTRDLHFVRTKSLPFHPNGMEFSAYCDAGQCLLRRIYYSVGGGFLVDENGEEEGCDRSGRATVPFPFSKAVDLIHIASDTGMSISDIVLSNECTLRTESEIRSGLLDIWHAMKDCVIRGCRSDGILPGGLGVKRRAPDLYRYLAKSQRRNEPLTALDWVNLWAIAVNEENASGGRVVTAPTNGAAGIIPAVLHHLEQTSSRFNDDLVVRFFLTAGAIGILYKLNASISGADVGCQGEVGVACSMAAGALAEALGGTVQHVEQAAEIGMEHNLGLTCDPVGGLVQIPCIERNAMAATKAINAARLAISSDGSHYVSLDRVIATMRRTGADMSTKYKETSRGGLAVNIPEC